MELLPVTAEYDAISVRMRQFAAQRLMEIIESMRPVVQDLFVDPLEDLEPGRIQAHVALLKLHTSLIKELGALYRVQERPREDKEETLPLAKVQELLDAAQVRMEEAVAAAAAAALEQGRLEAVQRQELSLQAARARVADQLAVLKR